MINQIWAGHPGSQILANIGSNAQCEVWSKPLGGDRTAVLVVNTADKAAAVEEQARGANNLNLVACNHTRPSQEWQLSAGVTPASGAITNVMPKATAGLNASNGLQCWSIHGCDTKPGSSIGLGSGCKKLPSPPYNPCPKACSCNDAWEFYTNQTIASAMTGQCLTVEMQGGGSKMKYLVKLQGCVPSSTPSNISTTQQWKVTTQSTTTFEHGVSYKIESVAEPGMCVDAAPAGPVIPPCMPPKCTPGAPAAVTIQLSDLGLGIGSGAVTVRDVWQKRDLPDALATGSFNTSVPHHGCTFFVFSKPGGAAWPPPFKVADWLVTPPVPPPPLPNVQSV